MRHYHQRRITARIVYSFLLFILPVIVISGCSSVKRIVSVKPNEHMEVGWTPRTIFQSPAYAAWFDTGYANYQPNAEKIERLRRMQDSVDLFVVYGTWCSDSKREIPRFFKITDAISFPAARVTLIAVDRTKQVPPGIAEEYNISNVPTFIIKYRGIEIGRIIESPKTTLEGDLDEYLSPVFP